MLEHQIKSILIDHLIETLPCTERSLIGAEIPIMAGKRWVDVLCLTPNHFHAYEIKSDSDSLSRLHGQITDLNSTFDYTTVVVSSKFINSIPTKVPSSVGIMFVCPTEKKLFSVRDAQRRKKLNKKNLGQFIWKQEILEYLGENHSSNTQREAHLLRKSLVNSANLEELKDLAQNSVFQRYKQRFDRFMSERGLKTTADDLINLAFDDKGVLLC